MTGCDLTRQAQNALRLARESSAQLGHGYVGSEHLLLGLLREPQGAAARALTAAGIQETAVQTAIAGLVGVGTRGCGPSMGLTPRCRRIIQIAAQESKRLGSRLVGTEHLLIGILRDGDGSAARILGGSGADLRKLYGGLYAAFGESSGSSPYRGRAKDYEAPRESRLLEQFTRDMTRIAAAGRLDPVSGREEELERVIQILCRRTKNNPVLLGEPGVGKTAVAEALAQRIANGQVPPALSHCSLLALDLPATVAGTKYRGEFEDRVKRILKEVQRVGSIILFLDELHTIIGAGSAEGSIDAANILKPALSRGEIQVLGATTQEEYRKFIRKDAALERRFQPVQLEPPTPAVAKTILATLRPRYESYHGLVITDEAIDAAVALSQRYLPDRNLPDKAIDLMDEAAACVKIGGAKEPEDCSTLEQRRKETISALEQAIRGQDFEQAALLRDAEVSFRHQLEEAQQRWKAARTHAPLTVDGDAIAQVLSRWTGIPVTALTQDEASRLLHLEGALHRRVIGQKTAVHSIASAIRRSRAGLQEENRPVGSFLFAGPSGVGKTELCRSLAQCLFGSEDALLRLDMSEYMEAQSVSRLIGSPPGYVGYEEGGRLTEAIRKRPYRVVLFDELEKAHPDVWNLLLQILEDGVLTDSQGQKADFRNAILIMTTNAGAEVLASAARPLGFSPTQPGDTEKALQAALRKVFRPEFLNRIDEIICFQPLTEEEVQEIAALMLNQSLNRLQKQHITVTYTQQALATVTQQGHDPTYGVRPMRRYLRQALENPAAELLLEGRLCPGSGLVVDAEGGELTLSVKAPTLALAEPE